MIPSREWLLKFDFLGGEYDKLERFLPIIDAIKLDALKGGMTIAAEIAEKSEACCAEGEKIARVILTIRDSKMGL